MDFNQKWPPDLISKWACLIFITILFYIIAFAAVKALGLHWIVLVWAFPIFLIWLFILAGSKTPNLSCDVLGFFAISLVLLLVVTLIAWALCHSNKICNEHILYISLVLWFIFGAILLFAVRPITKAHH